MKTPIFVVTDTKTNKKTICEPQIVISRSFPGWRSFLDILGLPFSFDGYIYIEIRRLNIEQIYEKLTLNPTPLNYIAEANNVISFSNDSIILHKGRYGDSVQLINEITMKIIKSSEDKDIYFTSESIVPHKNTLLALGYTIEEINILGFDAYKHVGCKVSKKDNVEIDDFNKTFIG